MMIAVEPIGYVSSTRTDLSDDLWGDVVSKIELSDAFGDEALDGIEAFSHVEVIYHFHRVDESDIVRGARHPRGNEQWPRVGIFVQRGKDRPNRLGTCVARVVSLKGKTLTVAGLDAIDGSPVVDIKPVMEEFLPRGAVTQPAWSRELMFNYWW